MAPKNRGSLLALGSLLSVLAFGSWGCCSVTCCEKQPHNTLVLVPPATDGVKIPDIVIRKSLHQEVVWKLPDGSPLTGVAIKLDGKPAPFVLCRTDQGVCHLSCTGGLCASGPIDPNLPVPEKKPGPYYEYDFDRPPGQASLDPGIRIDP
jgi:hypothetical protein